jgi:cytoskeletal protein CcmA (bactofilin family)
MWNRERNDKRPPGGYPSPPQTAPGPMLVVGRAPVSEPPLRAANIGESVVIKGEVTAEEDLLIAGRVEGRLSVEGHVLTIGPKASILADVRAGVAIVGGEIKGSVSASDKVEVREGGSVDGDITTPRIAVADGGCVCGRIDMPVEA